MTPEGKVKYKALRWLVSNMPGLWGYSSPGGPFGKGGMPDRLGLWRGIFFAIEVKRDHTVRPTELQLHQLKLIKQNGGIVAVLYGFEEHKLIVIRDTIIERSPNFGFENANSGISVPNEGALFGIFTPEGDVGFSSEE